MPRAKPANSAPREQDEKMAALARLANRVAHDLNNILTAVNVNAQLLLADLPTGDPKREELGDILQAGENAAALARQLLAFGRQRPPKAPPPLNLNETLSRLRPDLESVLGTGLTLHFALDPSVPRVRLERDNLKQILDILALNARDAASGSGQVTVQTTRTDRGAVLSFQDDGSGMDPDVLDRALEPFFSTKKSAAAPGLGLTLLYAQVRRAGGTVRLESAPGRGTTVQIEFPPAT